jgi:3-oxoacid CoA-transferase subunit A
VAKIIASYVGENKLFARKYLSGELSVEFTPQGTLAERLRAGGAGIAAFYTKTGVGTVVAEGKPTAQFGGEDYILERAIVADVAWVHAQRGDPAGNLVYHGTARNFNPVIATGGRITIAEVEVLDDDYIDPERVIAPGVFVDRIVTATPRLPEIERQTVRPRPASVLSGGN